MLTVFLLLIAFTAIPYGTVQPWTEGFVIALFFALSFFWFIEGCWQPEKWLKPEYKLLIPLLLMVVYCYLQTISWNAGVPISYDPYSTKIALLKLLAYTFTLGALLRYVNSARRIYALIWLVLGLAVICALFGLTRQAIQHEQVGFVLPLLQKNGGFAQYINKNHFATFMVMAFGLMLGLLLGRGLGRERWMLLVATALPMGIALIVCGSRSGVLATLAELAFVPLVAVASQPKERHSPRSSLLRFAGSVAGRILLVLALVTGGILSVIVVGGEDIVSRFEQTKQETNTDETNANRLGAWRSTIKLFKKHPITGIGFGGFWIAFSTVHDGSGQIVPQQSHNDYLEILASGGLIGVIIFLSFIVLLIILARQQLKSRNVLRRATCLGALTGLFGVAIQSMVEFGLHITFNALICMVLVALATANPTELNHSTD